MPRATCLPWPAACTKFSAGCNTAPKPLGGSTLSSGPSWPGQQERSPSIRRARGPEPQRPQETMGLQGHGGKQGLVAGIPPHPPPPHSTPSTQSSEFSSSCPRAGLPPPRRTSTKRPRPERPCGEPLPGRWGLEPLPLATHKAELHLPPRSALRWKGLPAASKKPEPKSLLPLPPRPSVSASLLPHPPPSHPVPFFLFLTQRTGPSFKAVSRCHLLWEALPNPPGQDSFSNHH